MKSGALAAMTRNVSHVVRGSHHTSRGGSREMSPTHHKVAKVVDAALLNGTAFGMAYANGRFGHQGELLIPGTSAPVDLTAGLGVHLVQLIASYFGYGGQSDNVHSFANGLTVNYGVRAGMTMGLAHAAPAPKVGASRSSRYDQHGNPRSDAHGNR